MAEANISAVSANNRTSGNATTPYEHNFGCSILEC